MKNISVLEVDTNGVTHTIYTDKIDLYSIGTIHNVQRASRIEFDQIIQIWNVINSNSNEIVFRHPNREICIEWEIEHFAPGGSHYVHKIRSTRNKNRKN